VLQQVPSVPGSAANRSTVQAMARELLEHADRLSSGMADEIHRNIDLLPDELRPDTFGSCRSNMLQIGTMLVDELEPVGAVAPSEAVHLAREFVRHALPMEALLRAYRIGHAVFMRWWLERLHERVADQVALAEHTHWFSAWSFTYVDAVSAGVTEAYMAERERWVRSAEALRADEIRAILEGRPVDEHEASQRLRYELARRHVALVVWADPEAAELDGAIGALERVAQETAGRLGGLDLLAVPLGRAVLAAWTGIRGEVDPARLDGWRSAEGVASGALVAVGGAGEGLEGFRRSHREAQLARRVATLGCRSNGSVVRFCDVSLAALLTGDLEQARRFVAAELGPLDGDSDGSRRLAATLKVFLEEGASFVRAARRLGVHENTVAYRVRRAGEVLGHGVEQRQLELRVALQLAELLRKAGA
jgi:DNA-binding PucR family transcriptional regulator